MAPSRITPLSSAPMDGADGRAHSAVCAPLLARVAGIDAAATERLLAQAGSLRALRTLDAATFRRVHGLTARQATRLADALALAVSLLAEVEAERPQIRQPADAAALVLPEMGLLEAEQMRVMLLDTKNRVLAIVPLYCGTIDTCATRVGEMFREAVRRNAAALVLIHNHPSGDPTPSAEDIALTRHIVQAGHLIDINVCDHLIVAARGFTSLRERRLGWD